MTGAKDKMRKLVRIGAIVFLVIPFGYIFTKGLFLTDGIVKGTMTVFDQGLLVASPWLIWGTIVVEMWLDESWRVKRSRILIFGLCLLMSIVGSIAMYLKVR